MTRWLLQEIFEGFRKWIEIADNQVKVNLHLTKKDLECLEAACLLHNIGIFTGKKGYHKRTYRIIMVHTLSFQDRKAHTLSKYW